MRLEGPTVRRLVAAAIVGAWLASAVVAGATDDRAHVNMVSQYTACAEDAIRLCPGMQPSEGRGLMCLRTHLGDLSTDCKRDLHKIRP